MPKVATKGRKTGSRNKGFFFRKGRGWYATDGARKVPLLNVQGEHIRDQSATKEAQQAYYRFAATRDTTAPKKAKPTGGVTVQEIADKFLAWCKQRDCPNTYAARSRSLFAFCTGLNRKKLQKQFGKEWRKRKKDWPKPVCPALTKEKLTLAFGDLPANSITKEQIRKWINAQEWESGNTKQNTAMHICRMFNWAIPNPDAKRLTDECTVDETVENEGNLLPSDFVNPASGLKWKGNKRAVYITPEQEKALYEHGYDELNLAIKVCILTGARHGQEFGNLTAKHVSFENGYMLWTLPEHLNKNRKGKRLIYVTNPELIQIVRDRIKRYPTGPLFRTKTGKQWTGSNLGGEFGRLVEKVRAAGVECGTDAKERKDFVMYACRHTFAKRMLAGFWNDNRGVTLEVLAEAMGNSPRVCQAYYSKWAKAYTSPILAGLGA